MTSHCSLLMTWAPAHLEIATWSEMAAAARMRVEKEGLERKEGDEGKKRKERKEEEKEKAQWPDGGRLKACRMSLCVQFPWSSW